MPGKMLKNYLMEKLKSDSIDSLWFSITKRDLLTMSEEELEIVRNFAENYYRGRYRLQPKSFYHFIKDQKYEEDCTVVVDIPFEELVKRGILTTSVEEGKTYWYLYGEKLDPKIYWNLYKKDWGTFKTLLEDLGLEEFMNEFNIDSSPNTYMTLFSFEYGGLRFDVEYHHKNHPTPTLKVYTYAGTSTATEESSNSYIIIDITVKNPKVEDVYKVEKLIKELRSDIEQKIGRISDWINKSCRYSLSEENMRVSGSISVRDYKFYTYLLSIYASREVDNRTMFDVSVRYIIPYDSLTQQDPTADRNFTVIVSQTIKSQYLINALDAIDANFIQTVEGDKEYTIRANDSTKSVTFEFEGKYSVDPDLGNLPDISEDVDTIMNMKSALRDIINRGLDKIRNKKVQLYSKYSHKELDKTVEDLIKFINWREDQTHEEAILKMWLLRTYLRFEGEQDMKRVAPDVVSLLISLAYLNGASYDYVLEKTNEGLDYIVGLIRRGKLRVTENEVYLNGKKIDLNLTNNQFIKSVIEMAVVLATDDERDVKISRVRKMFSESR
ncbi:MAG: hypothetical protein QXU08_08150 [Ignisphaera sp.]